jgi:hypothetical protein
MHIVIIALVILIPTLIFLRRLALNRSKPFPGPTASFEEVRAWQFRYARERTRIFRPITWIFFVITIIFLAIAMIHGYK